MSRVRAKLRFLRWPLAVTIGALVVMTAMSAKWAMRYQSADVSVPGCWTVHIERGGATFSVLTSGITIDGDSPPGFARYPSRGRWCWMADWSCSPVTIGWFVTIPLWMLLLALAIPAAWLWWPLPRPDHCPCGYDLAGLPAAASVCPECGREREQKAVAA